MTEWKTTDLLRHSTVKTLIAGGHGTGFFVARGYVMTCAHVVKNVTLGELVKLRLTINGSIIEAVIDRILHDIDIAILRVEPLFSSNLSCVYFDNSVQAGDQLYFFGYPDEDFPNGCPVTADCEGLTGGQSPLIKFKLGYVRPGMSGAPLLNRRTGMVCGIVKFTLNRNTNIGGGAIPVSSVVTHIHELIELQRQFHNEDRQWTSNINTSTSANYSKKQEIIQTRKTDLESAIRDSLLLINKYESQVRLTDDPRQQQRANLEIIRQKEIIKPQWTEYLLICKVTETEAANDLQQLKVIFE